MGSCAAGRASSLSARGGLLLLRCLGRLLRCSGLPVFGAPAQRLVRLRVDVHDVAGVDRALALHALALRTVLAGLLVLPTQVDAFDDHAVHFAQDRLDRPVLALVVSGDDDDRVSLADVHHTTSWASEMIFMKLRSRSSRATAPKIRVPRGLPSWSISTRALRSKRT